jgi:hypothetical protein
MRGSARLWRALLVVVFALAVPLIGATTARADIAPPWCGTPMPDAAENLPDGTDPNDPPGAFPHIPYYAIGCTLERIESESNGRMDVEVIGQSALGRDMYGVTINALETREQRAGYSDLQRFLRRARSDPDRAQRILERGDAKMPIYIQSGIHGNEYEGVDAAMRIIERLATTPYGTDPAVDEVLDDAVVVFNVVQNPDGRIAGTRSNGNGFDLNRDFVTQSQSETTASTSLFLKWLPTEHLDLHGYVEPTLVDGTTVPHNPSLEYDIFFKWNQPRLDANQEALASEGFGINRPVNDIPPGWIPEGETLPQGWDDWGPFYTATYAQLTGLDASTVEMCNEIDVEEALCGINGVAPSILGRLGSVRQQELTVWSTFDFAVDNREEMMSDQLEIYRRGVEDAPRPELTSVPPGVIGTGADHDYMTDYPTAHVIPVGEGQRSDAEAKRLVDFLLANDIEVTRLRRDYRSFGKGSYVVWMDQAFRGLANTILHIGDDISDRVTQLYAPPGAWSNGFLWGADVVTIDRGQSFSPATEPIRRARRVKGGVRSGNGVAYALENDSVAAVKTINDLLDADVQAQLATEAFESRSGDALPAGSVIFPLHEKRALRAAGRATGVWFEPIRRRDLPAREPVEGVPRIACLCTALENWALRELGFTSDQWTNSTINSAPENPLTDYDAIYNTTQSYPQDLPENATVRARYQAFFAAGGGYVGSRISGAEFLVEGEGGQVTGLEMESQGRRSTVGRATEDVDGLLELFGRVTPAVQEDVSGIVFWDNEQGEESPIVGSYPERDTGLVEDPVWFTDVPDDVTVDGRLPASDYLASGHWPNPDPSAGGSAIIVHGPNTANTARFALFGIDPLFRAHPERSFPAVSAGFYWSDIN